MKKTPTTKSHATIEQSDLDTPATVEDKVRALPENQGINDLDMWTKIDTEIAQSRKDKMLRDTEDYTPELKHQV